MHPDDVDWKEYYPNYSPDHPVEICDLGCGYGGLLMTLAEKYPNKLSLGMEIREKVSSYVKEKITGLREIHRGKYENVAVLKTNAMKCLPNYIKRKQLEKIFFLLPRSAFQTSKASVEDYQSAYVGCVCLCHEDRSESVYHYGCGGLA